MKAKMKANGLIILLVISLIFCSLPVSYGASSPNAKVAIALQAEPTTLDTSMAYIGTDYIVIDNWGEYLIAKDTSGSLKPGLASDWKISPDGRVIDFTLRKGVKFQSGDPLTAKDVAFSFERVMTKNKNIISRIRFVERVEVIDDYRFRIHFNAPDVSFIPNRAGGVYIVSKSYYDRVGEDEFSKKPLGNTGPYKVVSYVPGEYVDVERFESYWGPKPSVKEARFYFIAEDTTRVSKLKAGEVDLIISVPYPAVSDIEKSAGLKTVKIPANHPTMSVLIANRNPKMPWYDRRVRLAMAYAIDCDAIIKNIFLGIPNRWAFLTPDELGYDPSLKTYPYDPKKAKDLLREAGFPSGFNIKLYSVTSTDAPMLRETTEAIASYFEAVGIKTTIITEEWAAGLARRRAAKGPEAEYVSVIAASRSGSTEPSYITEMSFGSQGSSSVYSNPELDNVIAEARTTIDNKKRGEIIKKATKMVSDDVATIPICNIIPVYGMKRNVEYVPTRINFSLVLLKDLTIK